MCSLHFCPKFLIPCPLVTLSNAESRSFNMRAINVVHISFLHLLNALGSLGHPTTITQHDKHSSTDLGLGNISVSDLFLHKLLDRSSAHGNPPKISSKSRFPRKFEGRHRWCWGLWALCWAPARESRRRLRHSRSQHSHWWKNLYISFR